MLSRRTVRFLASVILLQAGLFYLVFVSHGRRGRAFFSINAAPWSDGDPGEVRHHHHHHHQGRSSGDDDSSSAVAMAQQLLGERKSTTTLLHEGDGMRPLHVQQSEESAKKPKLVLLVIVKTGPDYFKRRENVRALWFDKCRNETLISKSSPASVRYAAEQIAVHCLFVAGQPADAEVKKKLEDEVLKKKGDLFLAPVKDNYEMMTVKTQWILLWAVTNMDPAQRWDYVMMIDDDAFVAFTKFLPWLLGQPRRGFYAGHQHFARGVYRCETDPGHPNCVYRNVYPENVYPPFASGFGYIISRDVARLSVLRAITRIKKPGLPGNVEDAMLGVMLRESGIQLINHPGFIHWWDEGRSCRSGKDLLVVGNAPPAVLEQLRKNEQDQVDLCHNVK